MSHLFFEHQHNGYASAPFSVGETVLLDSLFGHKIGGKKHIVRACKASYACESGWLVYIDDWARPIDANWFKKI